MELGQAKIQLSIQLLQCRYILLGVGSNSAAAVVGTIKCLQGSMLAPTQPLEYAILILTRVKIPKFNPVVYESFGRFKLLLLSRNYFPHDVHVSLTIGILEAS